MLSELVPRIAHRIIPGDVSQRRIVVGNGYVFEGRFKTDVPAFFPRARTGSDSFRANNPATLISLASASSPCFSRRSTQESSRSWVY